MIKTVLQLVLALVQTSRELAKWIRTKRIHFLRRRLKRTRKRNRELRRDKKRVTP